MADVTWISGDSYTTINGNQIYKSSGVQAYDAGGYQDTTSVTELYGTDLTEGDTNVWFGISPSTDYNDFLTGIYWRQTSSGQMRIQSGDGTTTTVLKTINDTISSSDVFAIKNVGGDAKFYINDVEETGFTSPSWPTGYIVANLYQTSPRSQVTCTYTAGSPTGSTTLLPPPVAWI